MPKFTWLIAMMLAAAAVAAAVLDGEHNPVRRHPQALVPAAGAQHVIVKLRDPTVTAQSAAAAESGARLAALAARRGLSLSGYRSITADIHVMHIGTTSGAFTAEEVLARLRADPEVRYAELDQRRFIHSVPNDPLYPSTSSFSGQWYFMPSSSTTPSAIDAQTAWNTTTGAANIVIADIDTGVRFEHPDLGTAASGGRLLPGYCFISDPFIANNPACPGADASDPGDWVTQADLSASECSASGVTATAVSSWHGTRVAGVLGAIADNSVGIAGGTWSGHILPVRALGVCGGLDSDIITGMLWAGGIAVSGAPTNTTPARIINLSLGGSGSCPASYQDAVDQLTALGVLIVVSAGNETGPIDAPANCAGVAGIAGLRHVGTKVGYSNVGAGLAVAAPAGNCVNTTAGEPCVYPITTTTNLGSQGPGTNDYTGLYYCDPSTGATTNCQITGNQYRTYNLGTSFSAPQVASIGALMLAVNPKLNSCQLISRIKEGALPFPQTSAGESPQPPMCPSVNSGGECICTNDGQTCGAGMANANGAVSAALRPIAAVSLPASVTAGQVVQLQGTGSAAATGHTLSTFAWSNAGGQSLTIQNASTATASVTLPACGLSTVALTVTDNAGRSDSAQVVLSPSSVSSTAPATAGQTSCSSSAPAVEVAICPASATVRAGSGTQTFTASVANASDSAVTWQVDGIDGGNATVGTISSSGVYTAPAAVPPGGTVTVSALSVADGSAMASLTMSVTSASGSSGGGGGGALDPRTLAVLLALAAARLVAVRVRNRAGSG